MHTFQLRDHRKQSCCKSFTLDLPHHTVRFSVARPYKRAEW